MKKLILIDGNSILNRAFYGIMGSNILTASDGTHTNAIYGFLSILFKILNDENPEYVAVAFDLKQPTFRHKKYDGYKAQRKGMPNELAEQLPIIKDILNAMNIKVYEEPGFEADDILGTLSVFGKNNGLNVILLTGDRDSLQLSDKNVTPRIPITKGGKTYTEDYSPDIIKEKYGIEPIQFIEIKSLMGDNSDNIPGVPGVGEKTAFNLIQKFGTLDEVYNQVENLNNPEIKGKLREKLLENKELAYLSRELGTICKQVPLNVNLEDIKLRPYDNEKLYNLFKYLNFNKYIEKLELKSSDEIKLDFKYNVLDVTEIYKLKKDIINQAYFVYNIEENHNVKISFCIGNENYYFESDKNVFLEIFKDIFESKDILKIGYKLKESYIYLSKLGIIPNNMMFDIEIAAYILNASKNKYEVLEMAEEYLNIDTSVFLNKKNKIEQAQQLSLNLDEFQETTNNEIEDSCKIVYLIYNIYLKLKEKLIENKQYDLFNNIEMPLLEVIANMELVGMHIDKKALQEYGVSINDQVQKLTTEIWILAEQEFNINSPKQLRRNII